MWPQCLNLPHYTITVHDICMLPYVIMSLYNVDIHVHVQLHIMYMYMYRSACTCVGIIITYNNNYNITRDSSCVVHVMATIFWRFGSMMQPFKCLQCVCVCVCVYWVEASPGNVIYMYTCTCMLLIWAVLLWLVPNISDSIWLHNTLYVWVCVCVCVCVCVWAAYA